MPLNRSIRTAFFPDSYLEVNGAAMTCRRLTEYAQRNEFPLLCVHADKQTRAWQEGSISYLSLKRSPVSIKLDEDLAYDPLFQRHTNKVLREILKFKPDVLHITGLNDISIVGAYLGWKLQLPLVGSWHTNIHEFAASRLAKMFRFLPDPLLSKMTGFAERKIMDGAVLYYKIPKVVLSPNQELIDKLGKGTRRVSRLMSRGVDAQKFSPEKRTVTDGVFRLGFVGRLRAEKNVRMLVDLEKELLVAGMQNFKFLIVGEGTELGFLEKNLKNAEFTGFLDGDDLAAAYANMDLFVFPSETDAFGNVTQEANASGVPAIVTDIGGPKFIVRHGETGFIAKDLSEFTRYTIHLMKDGGILDRMKRAARSNAMSRSWDAVFESVYDAYHEAVAIEEDQKRAEAAGQ
ncbi:MAG: glycosyltransferase [Pyrinomonadaceae bacterium]